MSSRPLTTRLSTSQQAAIVAALPGLAKTGMRSSTTLTVEGRTLALTVVRSTDDPGWESELDLVLARRSNARVDRLLPAVATGSHDGCHWVAYEAGRATPLIAEGWRRWPAGMALDIMSDIAHTLDAAAAFGVMPYELPPASVFMEPRLGPLLGDLGAAREVLGNPSPDNDPGAAFTPPEVLEEGRAGARSGVYLCGALFYALLAGTPPTPEPVTRWRSDVPGGIDLVLATAMAVDPLERYRSASDFAQSAARALEGDAPSEPPRPSPAPTPPAAREELAPQPTPAPMPAATPAQMPVEPPAPNELRWEPPQRFGWPIRLAIAGAAVALAAIAGFQLGRPAPQVSAAGPELTAAGLEITLPNGWTPGVPQGPVVMAAYPTSDWLAGLTVQVDGPESGVRSGLDPVRLGALDMWRDTSEAPRVTSYVLPTDKGPVRFSCQASGDGPATALVMCERAISTLRLSDRRPLPLAGVAQGPGIRAPLARLRRARDVARAALARAGNPGAQRKAALTLERANARAARALRRAPGGAELAALADRTARAYGALGRATGDNRRDRWRSAVEAVRQSEDAFASALARRG